MKVFVVGSGGREHAIVWKLSQSPKVEKIYCAPGNPGIAGIAECVPIQVGDLEKLSAFALEQKVDITFVGPEDPLLLGVVNHFEEKGLAVFGPRSEAALIEGSKSFAKELMKKYSIPTAKYEVFTDYELALHYIREQGAPIVIKADGLAAGKGVVVAQSLEEAELALESMMKDEIFGRAGAKVVIEEFLEGEEMTLLAFVDGTVVKPMVPSQDHKPVYDGDKGPNTGGMGTYAPVPHVSQDLIDQIVEEIVKPTAQAMVTEGRTFRGILYTGLMMTAKGPKVIEYNARFGDPETQVVLPLLETDLLDILIAGASGELESLSIKWKDEAAVCVIMAAEGYPGPYAKDRVIEGSTDDKGAIIFHAGTAMKDGKLITIGGRVLGVTGVAETVEKARELAYQAIDKGIHFEGAHYRKDIAMKALNRTSLLKN
ncbi:MAG TPA: phosphoribosylamine--glycine ligase [Bacillota bacterium]|nr:phosphoribosylamine--glycine ligase [Bacillota bacterium]